MQLLRVHASVGRQNLSTWGNHWGAGGLWYSTTHEGECEAGHIPGDGTCSWRAVGISKAVNATCIYDRIDTAIETRNATCFAQCPPASPGHPWKYNRTTDCYSQCYSWTSGNMTADLRRAVGPCIRK